MNALVARWRRWWQRPELLPSRAAYARWSKAYPPLAHNRFMQLEQQTLLALLPDLHGKTVLDMACGTGRWGKLALERGAAQVISLDDSPHMLAAGRPPLAAQADMTELPLAPACADVVICGLAVGHVVTPRLWATLSEFKRVLHPGGLALVSDVHPTQAWHGAQRTFQDGRQTIAVEHYIHSYADYHAACAALGLQINAVKEVAVSLGAAPVLLALGLTKP
jgi:malonyl-CoA O-methyltransferase